MTGRHQGLKYITVDTVSPMICSVPNSACYRKSNYINNKIAILSLSQMSALLEGKFSCLVESFVVVDCRYPYEYQGGHIKVRDEQN